MGHGRSHLGMALKRFNQNFRTDRSGKQCHHGSPGKEQTYYRMRAGLEEISKHFYRMFRASAKGREVNQDGVSVGKCRGSSIKRNH